MKIKFRKNSSPRFLDIAVFLLLLLIGFFLFNDQFKFGLNSDEYRGLLFIKDNVPFLNFQSLSRLIPFGGSLFLIFILNLFVGYEPLGYYLVSSILRVIAAFSIYLLGKSLFKNKFVGLAASFLFMVSYAGVQSSAPANMGTYLAIGFMNFGLINLFSYFQEKGKELVNKTLLISYIWFFSAIIFNPVRLHGLVFLFIAIQITAVLLKINRVSYAVFHTVFFTAILLAVRKLGFIGVAGTSSGVEQSLLNINFLLKIPSPTKTLLYPLTSFYQMIFVPETNPLQNIFMKIFANFNLANPLIFLLLLLPPLILIAFCIRSKKGNRLFLSILSLSWLAFIFALKKIFLTSLASEGVSMLLGGFITFLIFLLINMLAKTRKIESLVLTVILVWPFCFSLIPHLAYPSIPHYTITRYFTVSVTGICLLTSYFIFTGTDWVTKILTSIFHKQIRLLELLKLSTLLMFFAIIFITNFRMVKAFYKSEGERGMYKKYMDDAFSIMNKEVGDRMGKNRPVVYLMSDNTDFTYLAITEGGEERFILLNKNLDDNPRPFFVTTYDNLLAIFCDHKYNLNPEINDIFAFKISNKQAIVETVKIRRSLPTRSTSGKCQTGHKNETPN